MIAAVVLDVAPPRWLAAAPQPRGQAAGGLARPARGGRSAGRHGLLRASTLLAMGIREHPEPVSGEWLADPGTGQTLGHQLGEVVTGARRARAARAGPAGGGGQGRARPARPAACRWHWPGRRSGFRAASCSSPAAGRGCRGSGLPEPLQAAVRVLRADLAAAPFAVARRRPAAQARAGSAGIAAAVRAGSCCGSAIRSCSRQARTRPRLTSWPALPQPFTAAQARQALRTTRRTAIPLLEFLDRAGFTERQADDRRTIRASARVRTKPSLAPARALSG